MLSAAAFRWPLRVYWEDTDAGGVVFYANYLKFFERSRTEWLRQLGVSQQALRERTGGVFVVSQTRLRYHAPARLDDALLVSTELLRGGRATLELRQAAWLEGSGPSPRLLCEGDIRIGWVDATTFKPGRIPPEVLESLKVHA